ncbi:MAG: MBG domain-containing protein [Candidatus Moraniibacteriota bacterium]
MKKMKRLFLMQLSQRELRVGKRIMASIMLPVLIFQVSSMNFLAQELMRASADEVTITTDAPKEDAPKVEEKAKEEKPKEEKLKVETPKEETKKEEAPKEEVKKETSEAKEKTVSDVFESAKEEVLVEVKTETPKEEKETVERLSVEAVPEAEVLPVVPIATGSIAIEDVLAVEASNEGTPTETGATPKTDKIVAPTEELQPAVEAVALEAVPVSAVDTKEVPKETWSVKDNKATTNDPVTLSMEYKFPGNENVTVRFTKLPEKPGTLSIEELKLNKEQIESIKAYSDIAYDITSDMEDGTFEYELTLPLPDGVDRENFAVKYAEDVEELSEAKSEEVLQNDLDVSDDDVKLELNHFTVFIVVGPNNGTIFPMSGYTWTNQQNATVSDNVYATIGITSSSQTTPYHKTSGFGFNVPADAVISGIEIIFERGQTTASCFYDESASLMKDGSTPILSSNKASSNPKTYWPTTDTIITYGSPTDLWNQSWTPAEINSNGFGFGVYARKTCSGSMRYARIDYVGAKVYYTLPDAIAPVITLSGDNPQTIVVGSGYAELGATTDDGSLVTIDATDFVDAVGSYAVTYDAVDLAGNNATQVTRTVHVIPKDITVTANVGQSKIYGDVDPAFFYTASDPAVIFTGVLARIAGENAGTYAINQGSLTAGNDYVINFIPADFTIIQKALTITAVANTKVYDSNVSASAIPLVTGSLVGTDVAGFIETYDSANVGTGKTLRASGIVDDGNAGNNYSYAFVENTEGIILAATQTAPDGSGNATSNSATPEVVITNPNQAVSIAIVPGTTNPTIDVGALIVDGTGALPEININSVAAAISIPAGTVTSADPNWNGIIMAPTITAITLPEISGQTNTLSVAIEVGFSGAKLSFEKAVRILLPNQAGKRTGYIRTGISFTEIANVCVADSQAAGDALGADGDCKIDVGTDLVIWTKHFTKFAAYSQTTNSVNNDKDDDDDDDSNKHSSRRKKKSTLFANLATTGLFRSARAAGTENQEIDQSGGTVEGQSVENDRVVVNDKGSQNSVVAVKNTAGFWGSIWMWLLVVVIGGGLFFFLRKRP